MNLGLVEEQVTNSVEEYLETIYRLQQKEGGGAKTNDMVKSLKVVPGTVTNTIERLEKEGYVEHEPYRGVRLTEKGLRIALQVVRRHRLSERLLTDILHVDWGKAHEAACKIEHGIADEEIIENIEKVLGNPKTCPHGNPIPGKEGSLIEEEGKGKESTPLVSLDVSEGGIISGVPDEDAKTLQHLSKLGLVPGIFIEVVRKEPTEGLITIKLAGSAVRIISEREAAAIKVKLKNAGSKEVELQKPKIESRASHVATFGDYEH